MNSERVSGWSGISAWSRFADITLQRTALIDRIVRDRAPDPLAGLKVDDHDLEALLAELPGLESTPAAEDLAADVDARLDELVAAARKDLLGTVADPDETDRFAVLAARAGLDPSEVEVLAVLSAVEVDPRRQRLVGYLNDDVTQRRTTPWTLRRLLGSDALGCLGPGSRLRRCCLVDLDASAPWGSAPISVPAAVLWWLAGDDAPDPELPAGTRIVQRQPGDTAVAHNRPGTSSGTVAVASGPDRLRRLHAVVADLGRDCLVLPEPPVEPPAWEAAIRYATLQGLGLVVEAADDLPRGAQDRVETADHLCWGLVSPAELPISSLPQRPWRHVEVAAPAATAEEWASMFPGAPPLPFPLTADQLDQVGRAAAALSGDLAGAVRRLAAGHIDAAATRIRPARGWEDLVLDDRRLRQVREVAVRARQRHRVFGEWGFAPYPSTGVVALFAGPSGTGKTLAAEVVAADLGVDLYKVDLANLVSKYIGETEKNLSRVFDAAEASRVVLFFDEADALLGRRSAVSDAHDRYANIEVAYLLQRLERYDGVAVLATNLASNLDTAFLRRLHVMVEFPVPEAPERRAIWARSIPAATPLADDVDLDTLANSVEVSGGTIRNAALGAAFLAAEAGSPITMAHAVEALQAEMRKNGRLVSDADFAARHPPPGTSRPSEPSPPRRRPTSR
jgi:hypothetical protein